MPAKKPESELETLFCDWAREKGCSPLKLTADNARGWPDRTVLCPGGAVLFLEFKTRTGKLSMHQVGRLKTLQSMGFRAEVVDNLVDAQEILQEVLDDAKGFVVDQLESLGAYDDATELLLNAFGGDGGDGGEWSVDVTNDGSRVLHHNGAECPHHLMQQLTAGSVAPASGPVLPEFDDLLA